MDFADYTETVYYWGKDYIQYNTGASNEQEDYVDWLFGKIKQEWVDKGYPVVMGEYGVVTPPKDKSDGNVNDLADTKRYYMNYVTAAAKRMESFRLYGTMVHSIILCTTDHLWKVKNISACSTDGTRWR